MPNHPDDTGIDQPGNLARRQRKAVRQNFLAMLTIARRGARRLARVLRQGRKGARGGIGEAAGVVGLPKDRVARDQPRILQASSIVR